MAEVLKEATRVCQGENEAGVENIRRVLLCTFAVNQIATNQIDDVNGQLQDLTSGLLDEQWVTDKPELVAAIVGCLFRLLAAKEDLHGDGSQTAQDKGNQYKRSNKVLSKIMDSLSANDAQLVALAFTQGCQVRMDT